MQKIEKTIIGEKPSLILDSGAFSADTKKSRIDIDAYVEFLKKNAHIFDYYFNLDVIGDGEKSYQNWKYLQKKGLFPIPVYHIGTDEKFLERYLRETNYVGIGAIASLDTKKRTSGLDYFFKKYFLNAQGFPKVKVHGLGLTADSLVRRYPWYSVDSSTPSIAAANGLVLLPRLYLKKDREFKVDWSNTIKATLSSQRIQKSGNFLALNPSIQEYYRELLKKYGYELGQIGGVKKNKIRNEYRTYEAERLFELKEWGKADTVADNHLLRFEWNIQVWKNFWETLLPWRRSFFTGEVKGKKRTHLYISPTPSDYVKSIDGQMDLLYSYYHITVGILKLFYQWKGYEVPENLKIIRKIEKI